MGRIVCFTGEGVSSALVKLALDTREIPYTEVSITRYPSKYDGLKTMTFSESLPQVFFNTRLIGGLEETVRQLEHWDKDKKYKSAKEKYKSQIVRAGEPQSILHLIPEPDEDPEVPAAMLEENSIPNLPIELPDGTKTSIVDITEKLKNTLPREDHSHTNIVYKKSFTGSDAGKVFIDSLKLSPQHAVSFGQHLLDTGVILSVGSSNEFVAKKSAVYRLQALSTPRILNSYHRWDGKERADYIALSKELDRLLTVIETESFTPDGKIDYTKAALHGKLPEFEFAVCELQVFNLLLLSVKELTAFALNVYKIMLRYAFIKVGICQTENDRLTLLNSVKFEVGGFEYSFREWMDGIIRGNKRADYATRPPFERTDERCKFCLPKTDYRVHFALNQDPRFGTMCGLPFSTFSADNIDEELQIASRIFFSDTRNIILGDELELSLPRFFAWYRTDFADNSVLVEIIAQHLGPNQEALFRRKVATAGLKFRYIDADWTRIAANYFPFEKQALKGEIKGVAKLLSRFMAPKTPEIESLRLATLHSLNILDTLPEERFDRITAMVKEEFDMPLVLVSLVDADRQWFKSKQWFCDGGAVDEAPREVSFCGHAILQKPDDVLVVPNALEDDRFADNPFVAGPMGLRFYAGCNLSVKSPGSNEQVNIGTLCCLDTKPRKFSENDIQKLRVYAFRIRREIRRHPGTGDHGSVTSEETGSRSQEMAIKA